MLDNPRLWCIELEKMLSFDMEINTVVGDILLQAIRNESFNMESFGLKPEDFPAFTQGWLACIQRFEQLGQKKE